MTRFVYPIDVPRGARLIDHALIVADVAPWNDGALVAVRDTTRTVLLPSRERVEIDEDTPERRARLAFALGVLADEEEKAR